MAAIDKMRERLAPLLVPGEAVRDRRQIMTPGTTRQMASSTAAGTSGLLGSVGIGALAGSSTTETDHLDPGRRIDLAPVHLGFLAFSDRRLFLVPASPKELDRRYELALQGMQVTTTDRGKLTVAARDLLAVAADGTWFLAEMPTGLGRAKKVDRVLDGLRQAIAAYG